MKITLKLYTSERERKNGFPIICSVVNDGKRRRITFGFYSAREHWDFERNEPNEHHPDQDLLNYELSIIKSRIFGAIRMKLTDVVQVVQFIKQVEQNEQNEQNEHRVVLVPSFYSFAETLIQEKEDTGNLSNAKIYSTAIAQLKKFIFELKFDEIKYSLLIQFVNKKKMDKLKPSSIHNYLRTLRAIYNEGVRRGITEDHKPFEGVFKGLKVRAHQMKKKSLDIEGIRKLENAELSGRFVMARDLFLLQFYLGGQDLVDIYYLKKNAIQGGRVYFKRTKVGTGYQFDVKLIDQAKTIIEKYESDDEFVFPGRHDFKGYETFRRWFGKYLILIQEREQIVVQPMGGNLGIKVARHTFANIGKRSGIDSDILRELMGHERDDVDNFYKDKFPENVRDDAQMMITGG